MSGERAIPFRLVTEVARRVDIPHADGGSIRKRGRGAVDAVLAQLAQVLVR